MTYDEFSVKLRKLQAEYRKLYGKYPTTITELEKFLDRRLASKTPKKSKAARSLKGLFL